MEIPILVVLDDGGGGWRCERGSRIEEGVYCTVMKNEELKNLGRNEI